MIKINAKSPKKSWFVDMSYLHVDIPVKTTITLQFFKTQSYSTLTDPKIQSEGFEFLSESFQKSQYNAQNMFNKTVFHSLTKAS